MQDRPRRVDHLLPLKPKVLHILLSLAGGPRHGYAVMQEVRDRTGGKVRLWPTALYGTFRALERQGWIEETNHRPSPSEDDERRRYFDLTGLGRRVLDAEVQRLRAIVEQANLVRRPRKARSS